MSKTDSKTDSKTAEAPRAEVFPTAFAIPGADLWTSFLRDQMSRMQAWSDEFARMEGQMFDRLRTTAGDASRMVNDSIGYASSLTAEWRKLALDAGKRAIEMTQGRS